MSDEAAEQLPPEITSLSVGQVNGLNMHVLDASVGSSTRGTILLLHGFPELAYSWRHVMPALAREGWRVLAPDQRGYGLTTRWSDRQADRLWPRSPCKERE